MVDRRPVQYPTQPTRVVGVRQGETAIVGPVVGDDLVTGGVVGLDEDDLVTGGVVGLDEDDMIAATAEMWPMCLIRSVPFSRGSHEQGLRRCGRRG